MDPRSMQGESLASQLPACASCKHQRKKCTKNCVLAPFFPAQRKQEFEAVHQVFGVSNVVKALNKLRQHEERRSAVDSIIWEALEWKKDPVNGPLGNYKRVCQELELYKNERRSLKPVQPPYRGGQTVAVAGTGPGVGTGALAPVCNSSSSKAMIQNFRHNCYQNFDTNYGCDANSAFLLAPHHQHTNGFAQPYSLTAPYNSMNNGNGVVVDSSSWEADA